MPNIPFTKEKVKRLGKGFHLTREVLSFDKQTGQFITYPNRKQRRDNIYRPLQGLNIDFVQRIPIFKYTKSIVDKKGSVIEKDILKKEYDKLQKNITNLELVGFKSIIHYKN